MRPNGSFPRRKRGEGLRLLDGADPQQEWGDPVPRSQLPFETNPSRGYVASSNQPPADWNFPVWLPGEYSGFTRARRINELLQGMRAATPGDMRLMQLDAVHVLARTLLPVMLEVVNRDGLPGPVTTALDSLKAWDFINTPGRTGPVLFDAWWQELYRSIWRDDIPGEGMAWPSTDVTLDLILNHAASRYFDDVRTSRKETPDDLIRTSLLRADSLLTVRSGPMSEAWTLGVFRGTDIHHLARIPALGRLGLRTGGGPGIINATSRTFGPSWRMVVELGPEIRGWVVYPGGQSGNPGSPFYDDMVDDWLQGILHPVLFLQSPPAAGESGFYQIHAGGSR